MRGAKKIKYASSHCQAEGFRYIWIDTCCIDKSSSAELSEAINSMYEWYACSIVCYAYLEDVESALSAHELDDFDNEGNAIRRSRWFTRGWTLQELIAPKRVKFFNSQWESLSSKEDLSPLLSSITTIPESVLSEPENRRNCSVARKMTWAAKRQTTRIEDIAYSLLGIFDVNMPLLYGEGPKAFLRLQEEILKETDDQSLLAWDLRKKDNWVDYMTCTGVLASSPEVFLGSEDVVPFPSKPGRQPQAMTNRGLRLEVPIWHNPNSTILGRHPFAVLNCQYENDFSGAIGIPLMTTRDDCIFLRKSAAEAVKCPEGMFKSSKIRTIYISKNIFAATNYRETETCLIQATSAEDNGYDIFPINSSMKLWNAGTKVLQMEFLYRYGGEWSRKLASSAIAFYNPGMKSCFIVMFSVMRDLKDLQTEIRNPIKVFAGPVGADRLSLEKWDGEGQESADWKDNDTIVLPNAYHPSGQITVRARIKREEILNQKVLVLSVSLD